MHASRSCSTRRSRRSSSATHCSSRCSPSGSCAPMSSGEALGRGADHGALAVRAPTPVTRAPDAGEEMVSLIGIAAATAAGARRVVGVEATGINACPCAQGLVRGRAAERLLEAGLSGVASSDPRARPLATHNQRGRGTCWSGRSASSTPEDLVGIVERSMSAPCSSCSSGRTSCSSSMHALLRAAFRRGTGAALVEGAYRRAPRARRRRFRLAPSSTWRRFTTTTCSRSAGERSELPRGDRLRHLGGHQTSLAEWLGGTVT